MSSEYELTGTAWDDSGIDSASFSLNGSESNLNITGGEFATLISLQPGRNDITVTATDTAGNEGSASRSVQWGALTTAAAARAFVSEGGTTPIGTFVINSVLTP